MPFCFFLFFSFFFHHLYPLKSSAHCFLSLLVSLRLVLVGMVGMLHGAQLRSAPSVRALALVPLTAVSEAGDWIYTSYFSHWCDKGSFQREGLVWFMVYWHRVHNSGGRCGSGSVPWLVTWPQSGRDKGTGTVLWISSVVSWSPRPTISCYWPVGWVFALELSSQTSPRWL